MQKEKYLFVTEFFLPYLVYRYVANKKEFNISIDLKKRR